MLCSIHPGAECEGIPLRLGDTWELGYWGNLVILHAQTERFLNRYDEAESVWVWEYLPEGEDESHDLFMDPGEQIR